jgi:hypothetical protein
VHRLAILEIVKRDHEIAMLHKEIEELRAAVKAEREACLKLATEAGRNKAGVAAAIRARGE